MLPLFFFHWGRGLQSSSGWSAERGRGRVRGKAIACCQAQSDGAPGPDLPYRQLVRRYGADLAYAPMLNSGMFVRDPKYRSRHLFPAPLSLRPLASTTLLFLTPPPCWHGSPDFRALEPLKGRQSLGLPFKLSFQPCQFFVLSFCLFLLNQIRCILQ